MPSQTKQSNESSGTWSVLCNHNSLKCLAPIIKNFSGRLGQKFVIPNKPQGNYFAISIGLLLDIYSLRPQRQLTAI